MGRQMPKSSLACTGQNHSADLGGAKRGEQSRYVSGRSLPLEKKQRVFSTRREEEEEGAHRRSSSFRRVARIRTVDRVASASI
ncbi:hypothetical protein M569_01215 [Genlisea aurea]|uniref:Uncharacterized protein n=1 Tax=Genlisea aurea TaxID=192259 RepID=S8EC75_9LAMI|nr:hypothetical protein M569_01215 [Genlisea aurea]